MKKIKLPICMAIYTLTANLYKANLYKERKVIVVHGKLNEQIRVNIPFSE